MNNDDKWLIGMCIAGFFGVMSFSFFIYAICLAVSK